MLLTVDPDPPLVKLATDGDPPLATGDSDSMDLFDIALFDDRVFDTGGFVEGIWQVIGDPGIVPMWTPRDPPRMVCETGDFSGVDFEQEDFVVSFGQFCADQDPPLVRVLVEADPA